MFYRVELDTGMTGYWEDYGLNWPLSRLVGQTLNIQYRDRNGGPRRTSGRVVKIEICTDREIV